ncbi:MAG: right-handed parallel beta-helix repeat-containing protein, partial [Patescibacteria group bacterium]
MPKSLKILFISCLLVGGFFVAKTAYGATEFTSIIDPDNGAGTDYTSLSAWEAAVQSDLSTSTTKVFSVSSSTGAMADLVTVRGETSNATGTLKHRASSTGQILLTGIVGTFQNGEKVYINGGSTSTNFVILSTAGDSAIAVASVRSTSGSADVTAVTIDGWTTSATNYIKIWTDPSLGNRHNGKWDAGKYRLEVDSGDGTISIRTNENYTIITGLQIDGLQSSGYSGSLISTDYPAVGIVINNNILKKSNYSGIVIGDYVTAKLYNNLIYDDGAGAIYLTSTANVTDKVYIYNNTLVDNGTGIIAGSVARAVAKNNLSKGNTTANYSGTFDSTSNYNASSDTSSTGGANDKISQTFVFVDEANDDFHLSPSDTAAKNSGTNLQADSNLSFSQDIDGSYRGASWDIGADEVPTEFVSTICENISAGGGCANRSYATLSTWESAVDSNLTASGTRIFSGTASGTLASGNTVTLYNGATSTGITGTIVATTTSQILIQNIIGTTSPVNVASGTAWQVTAANTWKNSGTADQLGASPIAVAKIDGAWASSDATAVSLSGWTTNYDNYIKIYTTPTARHNGKWDDGKYRLETMNSAATINAAASYAWIDGLQLKTSHNDGGDYRQAITVTSNYIKISNNII